MIYNYLTEKRIRKFIIDALEEDLGSAEEMLNMGDHSSLAVIASSAHKKAHIISKDCGILAGIALAKKIFYHTDSDINVIAFKDDGEAIKVQDVVMEIFGNAQSILKVERLVLNCMQRMSGIASLTSKAIETVKETGVKILDTRKTTPNFRTLEKWAVHIGGGNNHRFGLFDMIMLKDNHIDFGGGITRSVINASNYLKKNNLDFKIEIETRNLLEVREAIATGLVDIIMLDNMGIEDMKKAVKIVAGSTKTEASGGITLDNLLEVAQSGVDYISLGMLTHSAKIIDFTLKAY